MFGSLGRYTGFKNMRSRLGILSLVFCQVLLIRYMWNLSLFTKSDPCIQYLAHETKQNESERPKWMFSDSSSEQLVEFCRKKRNADISCRKLFRGDPAELRKVNNTDYETPHNNCSLNNLLRNCSHFIRAHEYKMEMSEVSADEVAFPLAFSLKIHKSPEQAEQLLRTIHRPQNVYCIHVDKKSSNKLFMTMKRIAKCLPNVIVIENRISVVYAHISIIIAELLCMHRLMQDRTNWKYYMNLAGTEFPLRTNVELVQILQSMHGANIVQSYEFPEDETFRYEMKAKMTANSTYEPYYSHKTPFLKPIHIRKGSQYCAFRREFVDFVLSDTVSHEFISWLHDTFVPDETVWATLNALPSAPGGYPLVQRRGDSLTRATLWGYDNPLCEGVVVHDVCVFGVGNLMWLKSRPELFVNKFDRDFDPFAVDCMEELIKNRTSDIHDDLDWFYYKNTVVAKYYANLTNV